MIKFVNPIEFMHITDINSLYDGMWIYVRQPDESKHFACGDVVAYGDYTDEVFDEMVKLHSNDISDGFIHYAHIDRGESLHVISN